ncbi:MAG: hypothetical protein P8O03_02915 [Ilumatobacter sp.]|nr:hypothetical protein [Ilumatobacter sp.]NKB41258.1 hypothetical protein [Ilumatobacter sp.]
MDVYPPTLTLAAGSRLSAGLRKVGSSAPDRRTTWAAPDPSTLISDPRIAPTANAVICAVHARWPAPIASMRVDLVPPAARVAGAETNAGEPFQPVETVALAAPQRSAVFDPPVVARPFPPPTVEQSAEWLAVAAATDRSGVTRRLAFGLVAAAGAACAIVATAISLL